MICSRQGLRKYKYKDKQKEKYNDKYKNNRHAYDIICFCKGDYNRSLIMKNVQNMQNNQNMQNLQNMQNIQNIQNMQNMQNISPLFFSWKVQKSKISESESSINSRTCLVGLGEIGPEDPNFKIKTCTLRFH